MFLGLFTIPYFVVYNKNINKSMRVFLLIFVVFAFFMLYIFGGLILGSMIRQILVNCYLFLLISFTIYTIWHVLCT